MRGVALYLLLLWFSWTKIVAKKFIHAAKISSFFSPCNAKIVVICNAFIEYDAQIWLF